MTLAFADVVQGNSFRFPNDELGHIWTKDMLGGAWCESTCPGFEWRIFTNVLPDVEVDPVVNQKETNDAKGQTA